MHRLFIKSAIIGAVSFAVTIYCLVIALAVLSRAGHISDVAFRLGPIPVFAVWTDLSGHHFTIGSGTLLVALLVGLVNGAGAVYLNRRRTRPEQEAS